MRSQQSKRLDALAPAAHTGHYALVGGRADAGQWAELLEMVPGQHRHLDELMNQPPAPGSIDWLSVIADVARSLVGGGGSWVVSFNAGEIDSPPTTQISPRDVLALVSRPEEFEPPAAYRLIASTSSSSFVGDHRRWSHAIDDDIVEVVSVSRSVEAREASEGWTVRISMEVGG